MQQVIRCNMFLYWAIFCLMLVAGQTLASVTGPLQQGNSQGNGENKQNSPQQQQVAVSQSSSLTGNSHQQQQTKHQQLLENVAAIAQQMTSAAFNNVERQGRSSLNSNNIDSSKYRSETDKKQVMEFFTPKNLFKNIIHLIWGNNDELSRTSRHVLDILAKALELLKNSFSQKARSASGRGLKDTMEDVASAGVSMLQGYVKSLRAGDEICTQKYICEASRDATRDGRHVGGLVAQVGSYASSYLLENSIPSTKITQATHRGKNNEDCAKLYPCQENHL